MKEKIYTIPLTDAFSEDSECAFCTIEKKLENEADEYTLGAAMMEPDFRIESNKYGYCRRHFEKLYNAGNALSLSLILQSHLDEILKTLKDIKFENNAVSFLKKNTDQLKKSEELLKQINLITDDCLICRRIENTVERYIDTFFYLWEKEEDFKSKVNSSKGFCLCHYSKLMATAQKKLSNKTVNEFLKSMQEKEMDNLTRLKEEIDWFTEKFDYRNQNASWKNSKDAPIRLVEKLGKFI